MLAHATAVTVLSQCLDPKDPDTMLEVSHLLSALCFVKPNGFFFLFCIIPYFSQSIRNQTVINKICK